MIGFFQVGGSFITTVSASSLSTAYVRLAHKSRCVPRRMTSVVVRFQFAVDWPPQLVAMLAFASSIFQMDFLSLPGLTCLTSEISFTYRMMFSTLVPVVGGEFLKAVHPLLCVCVLREWRCVPRPPPADSCGTCK